MAYFTIKISLQKSWYLRTEKMQTDLYRSSCLPWTHWAHIKMSEFKNGFLFTTESCIFALIGTFTTCTVAWKLYMLSLFGSNSANFPCSELQFCENPVLLLNELCSCTSASPVSDCLFSVSLFSAWMPGEVCSLSRALYQIVNRALCNKLSVPVLWYCGQNRELGAVLWIASWSPADIIPSCDGEGVVAVFWIWLLNCDNSTQCNVAAVHLVRLPDGSLHSPT